MAKTSLEAEQSVSTRVSREELLAELPVRSRTREVWTGGFVLAGIIAILVALFTLTDAATFRGRYIVTTVVSDAGGIRRGDPVQMLGVNIGRVQKFDMEQGGVAVRLELEGEYPVPSDSRVVLRSAGMLGGVVADVVPGTSSERLRGGAILPGAREEGVFDMAGTVGAQASMVLERVREALSDETMNALGDGAIELRALLAELNLLAGEQRRELASLISSLSRTAAGMEEAVSGPELARIVARLDSVAARAEEVTGSLGRASSSLETVLARVERGEGTLGRITVDHALYENMNQAAVSLDALLKDLKENPSRYLTVKLF